MHNNTQKKTQNRVKMMAKKIFNTVWTKIYKFFTNKIEKITERQQQNGIKIITSMNTKINIIFFYYVFFIYFYVTQSSAKKRSNNTFTTTTTTTAATGRQRDRQTVTWKSY